ncbi:MAG: T9SS type A sorting domain-containing protein [Bacteroidales bacterium]
MNNEGDLFLFGSFGSQMTFGNITIGESEQSQVFMAKYSDSSFNQPYTVVGLNNIETKDNNILVYPNPTKDDVYITTKGEQINSYSLYNINGQLLLNNEKVKNKSEKISLSTFPKGVYILKVVTDKSVYPRKVIKN